MNKTLIVLLAVCLISVHAFVRREAPEAPQTENSFDFQKKAEEMTGKIQEFLKSDNLKHLYDSAAESLKKGFESLQKQNEKKD